jgi:hypothetical protein
MNDEMTCTGIYTETQNKREYLDDPKKRQRDAEGMTPKQKVKYAKFYVRKLLEKKEEMLWRKRMTNPSLYKVHQIRWRNSALKGKGRDYDE